MKLRQVITNLKEITENSGYEFGLIKKFNERLPEGIKFYNSDSHIGLTTINRPIFTINKIFFENRDLENVIAMANRIVETEKKGYSFFYENDCKYMEITRIIEKFNFDLEIFRFFTPYYDGRFGVMDQVLKEFIISFDFNFAREVMRNEK